MSLPLKIPAYAKINLFLNLLGQRPDGFHEIQTVMQSVDWADELAMALTEEGEGLDFTCSNARLEDENNLVVVAYHQFYAVTELPPAPLRVHLDKKIPVEAGLGGGSSDAAAMLMGLNQLYGNPLRLDQLQAIAAQLGSDVPFFLTGGTALATGRGEIIQPVAPLPETRLVLMCPRYLNVSTPEAYDWIRSQGQYHEADFSPWERHLAGDTTEFSWDGLLYNDFESVLFTHYPDLGLTKNRLQEAGFSHVLVSGSGPTMFVLLNDPEQNLHQLQQHLSPDNWLLIPCRFRPPSTDTMETPQAAGFES